MFAPAVLAHKILASIVLATGLSCTGIGLYLAWVHRNHIVIRSRGLWSIVTTSLALIAWNGIQFTRIWEVLAPCVLIFFAVQVIVAVISSVIFYRTYGILFKLAMQQKAQFVMARMNEVDVKRSRAMEFSKSRGDVFQSQKVSRPRSHTQADPDLEMEEMNCCVQNIDLLRNHLRIMYCVAQFCVIVIIFIANPNNYESRALDSCYAQSSLHAACLLLGLFLIVLIGFRFLEVADSFYMIREITRAAVGIVTSFALFGLIYGISPWINDQDEGDLQIDVAVLQQVTISVVVVLMPGLYARWATLKSAKDTNKKLLQPKLLRILAHRESLALFRRHLLKEWSVENLVFYEDATKLQIRLPSLPPSKGLNRLHELYEKFISKDATIEINLSAGKAEAMHKFWRQPHVKKALAVAQRSRYRPAAASRSNNDFVTAVQMADKFQHVAKSDKDGLNSEVFQRLSAIVEEGMDITLAAKTEIFQLLENDSYKRFITKSSTQIHFKENKELLLGENSIRDRKARRHSLRKSVESKDKSSRHTSQGGHRALTTKNYSISNNNNAAHMIEPPKSLHTARAATRNGRLMAPEQALGPAGGVSSDDDASALTSDSIAMNRLNRHDPKRDKKDVESPQFQSISPGRQNQTASVRTSSPTPGPSSPGTQFNISIGGEDRGARQSSASQLVESKLGSIDSV
ncbi:hypothetical protein AAMO2058_000251400 [Amorphochlora amoebiformis]